MNAIHNTTNFSRISTPLVTYFLEILQIYLHNRVICNMHLKRQLEK